MSTLVACLSTGKGTWTQVSKLIEDQRWGKIILVTNEFGKENFTKNSKTELVIIDPNQSVKELQQEILSKLKNLITDLEISLNLISGSGKEHMALLSALLKLGLGINLMALTNDGIEEV
jgi:Na+-transporting NADH:ubiquinone oxidoreductase subunit NqrF